MLAHSTKECFMQQNTSVSLEEEFETFINMQISEGRFASESEVVQAGLRLLKERERKVRALRMKLQMGDSLEEILRELDHEFVRLKTEVIRGDGGIEITKEKLIEALDSIEELRALAKSSSSLTDKQEELANARFGGKKALANAALVFEEGLNKGVWNKSVEAQLRAMALSGCFTKQQNPNFWCKMAADIYFKAKAKDFEGEYTSETINANK